eukprot:scaffold681_cov173-Ochromonas_danica.AAC.20
MYLFPQLASSHAYDSITGWSKIKPKERKTIVPRQSDDVPNVIPPELSLPSALSLEKLKKMRAALMPDHRRSNDFIMGQDHPSPSRRAPSQSPDILEYRRPQRVKTGDHNVRWQDLPVSTTDYDDEELRPFVGHNREPLHASHPAKHSGRIEHNLPRVADRNEEEIHNLAIESESDEDEDEDSSDEDEADVRPETRSETPPSGSVLSNADSPHSSSLPRNQVSNLLSRPTKAAMTTPVELPSSNEPLRKITPASGSIPTVQFHSLAPVASGSVAEAEAEIKSNFDQGEQTVAPFAGGHNTPLPEGRLMSPASSVPIDQPRLSSPLPPVPIVYSVDSSALPSLSSSVNSAVKLATLNETHEDDVSRSIDSKHSSPDHSAAIHGEPVLPTLEEAMRQHEEARRAMQRALEMHARLQSPYPAVMPARPAENFHEVDLSGSWNSQDGHRMNWKGFDSSMMPQIHIHNHLNSSFDQQDTSKNMKTRERSEGLNYNIWDGNEGGEEGNRSYYKEIYSSLGRAESTNLSSDKLKPISVRNGSDGLHESVDLSGLSLTVSDQ